ncbi:hypothetical protein DET49_11832 [Salegentibacter sp. 24]|jgi:hypothetical protein|nr:hypothetical protein DET49_11832 [Salegentibacter sp. 24]
MVPIFIKYRVLLGVLFYLLMGSDFFTNVLGLDMLLSSYLNWTATGLLFIFLLFIVIDMFRQKLNNKTF